MEREQSVHEGSTLRVSKCARLALRRSPLLRNLNVKSRIFIGRKEKFQQLIHLLSRLKSKISVVQAYLDLEGLQFWILWEFRSKNILKSFDLILGLDRKVPIGVEFKVNLLLYLVISGLRQRLSLLNSSMLM